jgi:hypothetical protein
LRSPFPYGVHPLLFGLWFAVWCVVAYCFVPFLLVIVLSVLLRFSASGCPFVFLPIRPEMCLSRAFYKSDISLSLVRYQNAAGFWWLCFTGFGFLCCVISPIVVSFFFWPLCCLSLFNFRLLVAPLASWQLNQKCFNCAFHIPSTNRTFPHRWCTIGTTHKMSAWKEGYWCV